MKILSLEIDCQTGEEKFVEVEVPDETPAE